MKKVMFTVVGSVSSQHWVSDLLLIAVTKVAQALARDGTEVVYANSFGDPNKLDKPSVVDEELTEVFLAKQYNADSVVVFYLDNDHQYGLYERFMKLKQVFPYNMTLYFYDVTDAGLSREEKISLGRLGCRFIDFDQNNSMRVRA